MDGFIKITTGGSPRRIGRDIGRATAGIVRELAAANAAFYRRQTGRTLGELVAFARRNLLPLVARAYPGHLEEVRGLAEGAGLGFDEVFLFSAEEELLDLWGGWDKCSSAAVRCRGGLKLAHNEDYIGRYHGRLVVVDAAPSRGPRFLSLAYPGTLAGSACGLNAAGLAFSGNSLHFGPRRRGLPKNFVLRDVLAARNVADAVRRFGAGPRLVGGSLNVVSSREDAATCVESSLADTAVVRLSSAVWQAHTNHALAPGLDKRGEKPTAFSRRRLAGIEGLLAAARRPIGAAELKSILSSRAAGLFYVDRRPDAPSTLASIVMDPGSGSMLVAPAAGRRVWRRYSLK